MNPVLNHVAFSVSDLEWHIHFFENVFEMSIKKIGNPPNRKVWMNQGIQLIESPESAKSILSESIVLFDHIAFTVSCPSVIMEKAIHFGCTQVDNYPLWFSTPSGIVIELLEA